MKLRDIFQPLALMLSDMMPDIPLWCLSAPVATTLSRLPFMAMRRQLVAVPRQQ